MVQKSVFSLFRTYFYLYSILFVNQTKHALRVLLVRVRRQMEMQAFPLALCLRAKKALSLDILRQRRLNYNHCKSVVNEHADMSVYY